MRTIKLAFLAAVLGVVGTTSVYAHDTVGFSIHFGAPGYYAAPPVYYSPQPVYYARPSVYYAPAPVYYEQRGPIVYSEYDEPRYRRYHDDEHHGWHRHHREDDDD